MNSSTITSVPITADFKKNSWSVVCCLDFKITHIGESLCRELGLLKENILDKKISQINSPINHLSDRYREIGEKIINSSRNISIEYYTILPKDNKTVVFHSKLSPIVFNGVKVGLYSKIKKLNAISTIPFLKKLDNINKAQVINSPQIQNNPQLSEKEEFILFMIGLGKYDKEIAYFLYLLNGTEITKDAITKIVIRNLYEKFNVTTRSELIIKAHSLKYLENFPRLLTPQCILKLSKFL